MSPVAKLLLVKFEKHQQLYAMLRIVSLLLLIGLTTNDEKLRTNSGQITFEASVPAFEEVTATSKSGNCVLHTKTGDITTEVKMTSFKFRLALMEEHFNKNYVESHRYPKAYFKGKINDFNFFKLSPIAKNFTIQGKMELHGETKDVTMQAQIRKVDNGVEIKSSFILNTDDFNIDIPAVIKTKVSKQVNVRSVFTVK